MQTVEEAALHKTGSMPKNGLKKVVFTANTAWSLYQFRLGVMRRLRSRGHTVVAVAPWDSYAPKLMSEGFIYHDWFLNSYSRNPIKEWKSFWSLRRLYRRIEPDVLFHYTLKPNVYGSVAAFLCGIPSVAVATGIGHLTLARRWHSRFGLSVLYCLAGACSDECWVLNKGDEEYLLRCRLIPGKRLHILPGEGVNTDFYHPRPIPVAHRLSNTACTFLYAGRLLREKGVKELAIAARRIKAQFPRVRFVLVGDLPLHNPDAIPRELLREWIAEGLFQYAGTVTDVRPFLHQADCLVLPSWREGLSRIIMEAASSQLPVITTRVPGCRELVLDGKTGLLCTPRDGQSLTEAILHFMYLDKQAQLDMGMAGRRYIRERYDEKLIADRYLRQIEPGYCPTPEPRTASIL